MQALQCLVCVKRYIRNSGCCRNSVGFPLRLSCRFSRQSPFPPLHSTLPMRTTLARFACTLQSLSPQYLHVLSPLHDRTHGRLLRTRSASLAGPARVPSHGPSWLGSGTLMSERCCRRLSCKDAGLRRPWRGGMSDGLRGAALVKYGQVRSDCLQVFLPDLIKPGRNPEIVSHLTCPGQVGERQFSHLTWPSRVGK